MIKRPLAVLMSIANLLIIFAFIYSARIADGLLTLYNLLLVYLSVELSVQLCQRALQNLPQNNIFFVPNLVYRNLKMLFLLCYFASQIAPVPGVSGFLAVAVGLLFIADLREFHYRELLKLPVLLFYAIQACSGAAYLWLGYLQLTAQDDVAALYALFLLFSLPFSLLYLRESRAINSYRK
ncbi:hypothetical protein [Aggregatibacter kilianii]|uniref:hypothetical protein n=1 Tax=Aggregatibacter kilianii TaxID=2025884 RepID=UPI000D65A5F1|nr:hypothetical protein [Aggregatibacter kilianii]